MKVFIMLTILAPLANSQSSGAPIIPQQKGDGKDEILTTIKDIVLTTLSVVGLDGNGGGVLGPTRTGSRSLKELQDDPFAISGHEKLEEIEAVDAAAFRAYVTKQLVELLQAKKGASDSPPKTNEVSITAPAGKEAAATK